MLGLFKNYASRSDLHGVQKFSGFLQRLVLKRF